jgi:adenosylcobinamide-GDP ribazoletransferase
VRFSHDLRTAAAFLTRVPLHPSGDVDLPRSTPLFPAVGVGIGACGAAVFVAASEVLPSGVSAALAIGAAALITGAFHHDGLADMADAFGGGWDREQRLAILKDSRHGTYGVMALIIAVLVQWSSLASLGPATGAGALVAANAVGRSAILGVMLLARPARLDGLGTDYSAGLRRPAVCVGALVGWAASVLVLGWWVLPVIVASIVTSTLVVSLARRKIGGFSGDVLGATELVAECAALVVACGLAAGGHTLWWA